MEHALYSGIICSRIAIGQDLPDGSLLDSAYNKILFFPPFLLFHHGKGETKNHLTWIEKHHIVKWNGKILLNFHLWEWH